MHAIPRLEPESFFSFFRWRQNREVRGGGKPFVTSASRSPIVRDPRHFPPGPVTMHAAARTTCQLPNPGNRIWDTDRASDVAAKSSFFGAGKRGRGGRARDPTKRETSCVPCPGHIPIRDAVDEFFPV